MSPFQGEKENESKWSTASSARAGADEPREWGSLPAAAGDREKPVLNLIRT